MEQFGRYTIIITAVFLLSECIWGIGCECHESRINLINHMSRVMVLPSHIYGMVMGEPAASGGA
jgi:hypothetical protein